jgi:hypothetical protein
VVAVAGISTPRPKNELNINDVEIFFSISVSPMKIDKFETHALYFAMSVPEIESSFCKGTYIDMEYLRKLACARISGTELTTSCGQPVENV